MLLVTTLDGEKFECKAIEVIKNLTIRLHLLDNSYYECDLNYIWNIEAWANQGE